MAEFESIGEAVDSIKNNEVDAIIALDSNIDILKEDSNDYNEKSETLKDGVDKIKSCILDSQKKDDN